MEKLGEDELKGLEEEIDSAVDRLFVEKERESEERLSMRLAASEALPHEKEREDEERLAMRFAATEALPLEKEQSATEVVIPTPSKPLSFFRSGERMETQLLSLEWEITKENLHSTQEEVLALQRIMKEKPDITAILKLMEKVIQRMIEDEERITPPWIKFLMDSKETIKLLMRKGSDNEIDIYKQLASAGIEARFSCLEGLEESEMSQPALSLPPKTETADIAVAGKQSIQDMLSKMNRFLERMEEILRRVDTYLSNPGRVPRTPLEQIEQIPPETPLPLINVTVFKVDDKLFGVESNRVFRLFKISGSFPNMDMDQQTIRLKDLKVRMIDLKRIFSIQGRDQRDEVKILTVKANGEYKGLMVDDVLRRLSTRSDFGTECGEYFLGKVRWTYEQQAVEVPILDLKKF